MKPERKAEIEKRTDEEVKAEYQLRIDTRDKNIEAIAKKIKERLSRS